MNVPEIPSFPDFTSDALLQYFKMWELLKYEKDHPIYTYDSIAGQYVLDESTDFENTLLALSMELKPDHKKLVFSEQETTKDFFETTVDQIAFWSEDHKRIRKFLIDWYSTQRALVTRSRRAVDPYSLSDEELNDLILSFGYPYPYEVREEQKSVFLHELIGYYQKKGTPKVLGDVLTFYGLVDAVICEWWLYNDFQNNNLWVRSVPVWPKQVEYPEDYNLKVPYESFVALDPYWHYDKDQGESSEILLDLYREMEDGEDPSDPDAEKKNKITLPSITPYISLNTVIKGNDVFPQLSVLNRKVQEDYEFWIQYILKWKGSYSDTSSFPSSPETNWVVFCEDTQTHFVYNGQEWVDLTVELPSELVESEPDCNGQTDYFPIRNVSLNIYGDSRFSLLESMIGLSYILGAHFGLNSTRKDAVPTWSDLPVPASDNDIRRVISTGNDAIYYLGEWHDFKRQVNYDVTNGNLTFIGHVPPTAEDANYLTFSHLEYNGKYSPLDYVYDMTGEGYLSSCRDQIDDVSYSWIKTEWDELHARPKDEPILSTDVGPGGTETREYYTAWKKRQENLEKISDSFYRKPTGKPDQEIELVDYFLEYDGTTNTKGWIFSEDTTLINCTLVPENKEIQIISSAGSPNSLAIYLTGHIGDEEASTYSGIFELQFDYLLVNSSQSNLRIGFLTLENFLNPETAEFITVTSSGFQRFVSDNLSNFVGFIIAKDGDDDFEISISNITCKQRIKNTTLSELEAINAYFDSSAQNFSINSLNEITEGNYGSSWICYSQDSTVGSISRNEITDVITFDSSADLETVVQSFYFPYGFFKSEFILSNSNAGSKNLPATFSFDVYDSSLTNLLLICTVSNIYEGITDYTKVVSQFVHATEDGSYSINIDLKYASCIRFDVYKIDEDSPGFGTCKIGNMQLTGFGLDEAENLAREHYTAYFNSQIFLKAMNPNLLTAIDTELYLSGLLYPNNMKKMVQIQETYLKDLGAYFKDTMGLRYLWGLANYIFGLVLYKELKKVINFLKPYRARFRSFMTEYSIEDPIADGSYVQDKFYMPKITQKLQELNLTNEQLTMSIVMLFEEMNYRFGRFDRFGNPLGGPGVHPFVFDGINRSLEEVFKTTIKIKFSDSIRLYDVVLMMLDVFESNDIGPYNFDNLRVRDLINNLVIKLGWSDSYWGDELFDINRQDEFLASIRMVFEDDYPRLTDVFWWGETAGIFVDDYGPTYSEGHTFETARTSDSGYIELTDDVSGLVYNRIALQTRPEDFDVFTNADMTAGVPDVYGDDTLLPKGCYEMTQEGDLAFFGTEWNVVDGKLVSDPEATNSVLLVISDTVLDGETGQLMDWANNGAPYGTLKLSYDIDIDATSTGEVFILSTDNTWNIGGYAGNPNFAINEELTSDSNVVENQLIPNDAFIGVGVLIIGPTIGSATITINDIRLTSVSWTGEANLRIL